MRKQAVRKSKSFYSRFLTKIPLVRLYQDAGLIIEYFAFPPVSLTCFKVSCIATYRLAIIKTQRLILEEKDHLFTRTFHSFGRS